MASTSDPHDTTDRPDPGAEGARGGGSGVDPTLIRVLDPGDPGGSGKGPTAYVVNRLLLSGYAADDPVLAVEPVQKAIDEAGLPVRAVVAETPRLAEGLRDLPRQLRDLVEELWVTTLVLEPREATASVDAQTVLAAIWAADPEVGRTVALDHVLLPAGGSWGSIGGSWGSIGGSWGSIGGSWGSIGGSWGSIGGSWGSIGTVAEYGVPGLGGRTPVRVVAHRPAVPARVRRPVVAMPDSGICTDHPWFDGDDVEVGVSFHGLPIGGVNADLGDGVEDDLTGTLPALAGHGTFVAGLVRQACPAARLLSVPVADREGVADEGDLHRALVLLLLRHAASVLAHSPKETVDVLSISLGYYHEDDEPQDEQRFRRLFRRYGDWGVAVVAGAGNDATTREFLPAAFALADAEDEAAGTLTGVPLVSVGALNPNGTVALFSNAGHWVRTHDYGAAVVSTMPTGFVGGGQPSRRGEAPDDAVRSTIDLEDFSGGFAVWSGTSFATPVLAGEIAHRLAEASRGVRGTRIALEGLVARVRAAVDAVVERRP